MTMMVQTTAERIAPQIAPQIVVDGVVHMPTVHIGRIGSGGWRWQATCCDTWRAEGEVGERVMRATDYFDSPTEIVRRVVLGYAWRNHILNVMSRNRAENEMHLFELYEPTSDLRDPIKVAKLYDPHVAAIEEIKRRMAEMTDDLGRAYITATTRQRTRPHAHPPRGVLARLFG